MIPCVWLRFCQEKWVTTENLFNQLLHFFYFSLFWVIFLCHLFLVCFCLGCNTHFQLLLSIFTLIVVYKVKGGRWWWEEEKCWNFFLLFLSLSLRMKFIDLPNKIHVQFPTGLLLIIIWFIFAFLFLGWVFWFCLFLPKKLVNYFIKF